MHKIFFFMITIVTFLICPLYASAGVNLPWSTTYDCAEWLHTGDALNCDGLSPAGGWTSDPEGYEEQIVSGANYPGGGGNRGQRHWVGDGTNENSGGTSITFNTPQTNIWIRWYMRWESGFSSNWDSYKALYLWDNDGSPGYIQPGNPGTNGARMFGGSDIDSSQQCYDCLWGSAVYPTGTSDGSWHYYEVNIDIAGGKAVWWVDGVKIIDATGISWNSLTNVSSITIGSNCKNVVNGRSMYVDYDDIAISNTGYIGPLAGGGGGQDNTAPTISTTSPIDGSIVTSTFNLTAIASDNVGVSEVEFKIDGAGSGLVDNTSPYSVTFNTTTLSDGSHTLTAVAKDAAGNQTTSSPINFIVQNDGGSVPIIPIFSESFEDTNFSSRGWYDNSNLQLTSVEHISGSTKSLEFHYTQGATTPTSGGAVRKKFTETDQIYISYYVKYSANWEGSNQSYHPHEFYILTNLEDDWAGLASTHLTTYIEQNEGEPLVAIQDSLNIDESNINIDLTLVTENRAVAGCNGDSDGHGNGSCYSAGGGHLNGKQWRAGNIYFQDTQGAYYKNTWHFIEAFIKLNSITNGKANADGIIQYWYDGQLVIDHSDVVLRTGQYPNMQFNQFVIGPYIGDGSPVSQTFWIDDLSVATSRTHIDPPQQIPPPPGLTVIE